MGTFCINRMFPHTDPIVKTDSKGRCTDRNHCIFKWIRINWSSINVTGISGTMFTLPDMANVSIFMDWCSLSTPTPVRHTPLLDRVEP